MSDDSKKYYNEAHQIHKDWAGFLFEQAAEAQMAQIAAGEAAAAEQAAQMQAQQAEAEMLGYRQGVGGAIGEVITLIYQLSQKGEAGVQQAKAAASGVGAVLHKIASNRTDPNRAGQEIGGVVQRAAMSLRKLGG